ncbi:MAG: hypothetical protein RLZZ283_445 [Candidatus Parcubacteria bacterium]|jgi:hypothetical protein
MNEAQRLARKILGVEGSFTEAHASIKSDAAREDKTEGAWFVRDKYYCDEPRCNAYIGYKELWTDEKGKKLRSHKGKIYRDMSMDPNHQVIKGIRGNKHYCGNHRK